MFQCNTLCRNTKCRLCSPLAKDYVAPCIIKIILFWVLFNLEFHPVKTLLSLKDAEKRCSQIGSDVILPKSVEDNLRIRDYMREQNIDIAWIGITEVTHPPEWIDGNKSKCDMIRGVVEGGYLFCVLVLYSRTKYFRVP